MTAFVRRIRLLLRESWDALMRGHRFLTHDVWHVGQPGEEIPHGLIIKQVRVLVLLLRSLFQGNLLLRASALTFATILSIVPFLALMIFIVRTFNLGTEMYAYVESTQAAPRQQQQAPPPVPPGAAQLSPGIDPTDVPPPLSTHEELEQYLKSAEENGGLGGLSDEQLEKLKSAVDDTLGERRELEPISRRPESELGPNDRMILGILGILFQDVAQEEHARIRGEEKDLDNPVDTFLDAAESASDPKVIGLAGLFFILTTAFGLLLNIEMSFNSIWGVSRSRSWFRTLSDYIFIILTLPFLAAVVLGVTVALQSESIAELLGHFSFAVRGVQFVVIWLGFAGMYYFIPSARVRGAHALTGAFVAALLWNLLSWAYVSFQIGLANYNLIYSGFAQFPLLLMWIYFSWIILLLGAEMTFAYQYEKTFVMERMAQTASHAYREALGVRAMLEITRRFDQGLPPMGTAETAERWKVPARLMNNALDSLADAGLVVSTGGNSMAYMPARPIDRISLRDVVMALREAGRDPSPLREDPQLKPLLDRLNGVGNEAMDMNFQKLLRKAAGMEPGEDAYESDAGRMHAADTDEQP